MRKVAVLIATLVVLRAHGFTADVEAPRPHPELQGVWEGTLHGWLRGDCPNREGQVHPIRLVIGVDDRGNVTAVGETPNFHPGMRTQPVFVGKLDDAMHLVLAQEFSTGGSGSAPLATSYLRWTGDIKETKKGLTLQLHAIVRIHTSNSNTCTIDGVIRVSKPLPETVTGP